MPHQRAAEHSPLCSTARGYSCACRAQGIQAACVPAGDEAAVGASDVFAHVACDGSCRRFAEETNHTPHAHGTYLLPSISPCDWPITLLAPSLDCIELNQTQNKNLCVLVSQVADTLRHESERREFAVLQKKRAEQQRLATIVNHARAFWAFHRDVRTRRQTITRAVMQEMANRDKQGDKAADAMEKERMRLLMAEDEEGWVCSFRCINEIICMYHCCYQCLAILRARPRKFRCCLVVFLLGFYDPRSAVTN